MPRISELPAGAAAAADEVPVNKAGTTTKVTVAGFAIGGSRVMGLIGINNSVTPNTQYDLSADTVVLRNTSDGTIAVRTATGTITNDTGLAGSAANGRDQAGAFSASSWVHFYFIWNGTTLATLSSTVAPPTGPTLPTGYTHWAYAGAVRYNATPVLLPTRFAGALATYGVVTGGEIRILSAGTASTMTAVSAASYVPPNSRIALMSVSLADNTNPATDRYALALRPTGATDAGQDICTVVAVNGVVTVTTTTALVPVSASQSLDYVVLPASPAISIGAFLDVYGYVMPNGDS